MTTFCTIITADYLPLANALRDSIRRHGHGKLLVLVVDEENTGNQDETLLRLHDLAGDPFFKDIERKYAHTNNDLFRWALKPVLIGHLLDKGYDKVIFVDPDIFFVNQYDFLFDLLDTSSVILTPHWVNLELTNNEDSVLSILTNGVFNAGFVAAGRKGRDAIYWWAGMCHYRMEKSREAGVYDDQKYLDVLPAQFDNVLILKHQGCNLASWNIKTCRREEKNGSVLINGRYEPVFIHFAKETILNILNRNDALLRPYLDEYIKSLSASGFDLLKNAGGKPGSGMLASSIYSVKHKLRLRTRFKRFLFRLAEKL